MTDTSSAISAQDAISILLADPNRLLLGALAEHFERDPRFSLVATLSSAEQFLTTAVQIPSKVGIIDWNLPVLGGQRLIEILREHPSAPRIVVYSNPGNPDIARRAMAAGAAGYCTRDEPVETLLETAATVAGGQMVFPFLDVRELSHDPTAQLTAREKTLLEELATGKTNKQLAAQFSISVNTVKFHLSNLFDKLNVHNRSEAVAFYYASKFDDGSASKSDLEALEGYAKK